MKNTLRTLLVIMLGLICSCGWVAGETTAQLVKNAIERLSSDNNFYGIVLVHDCEGNDLYTAEGSVAINGKPFKYNAQRDQFQIASVSKQFAAAALLNALWESHKNATSGEERLNAVKSDLQKPVAEFFKTQPHLYVKNVPNWAKRVTLHQLLSHTSGLDEVYDWSDETNPNTQRFYDFSRVIDAVFSKRVGLRFKPGSGFFYSGSNYALIAAIIENLTQKSFDVYLKGIIFDPLKMTSTFVMPKGSIDDIKQTHPDLQLPMKVTNGTVEMCDAQTCEQVAIGGSGIVSTVEDLKKWQLGLHCKQTVLNPDLYQLMIRDYTPTKRGYGYGIMMGKSVLCGDCLSHYGMEKGYRSLAMIFLKDHIGIIILSNLESPNLHKPYGYEALQNAIEQALQLEE